MTTTGHDPLELVVFVTVIEASSEQPSEMDKPNASSAATVFTGEGAIDPLHPVRFTGTIDPVIAGGILSTT